MGKSNDQISTQAGIALLTALALLVAWEFWLENIVMKSLLGLEVHKTPVERWEFVLTCLALVLITLVIPFRVAAKKTKELSSVQNALKGERSLSQVFFHVDNSIILVIDTSNKIMQVNAKASELLGFTENDLMGKDWINHLVPEKSKDSVRKQFMAFVKDRTKHFLQFETPLTTKSKKEKQIEWQAAPLVDERSQIYGTIMSGQDVAVEKQLLKQITELKNKYEPYIKKLTLETQNSKQKYHKEAIRSASTRAKFKFMFELENKLIGLSSNILSDPDEINRRIKAALQAFGSMSGVDHGFVFQFIDDGQQMVNTHLWVASEPLMEPDPDEHISLDTFPWFKEKINHKQIIHVPKIEDLPAEANSEKEVYNSQGVKSLINVPLVHNDKPVGYLGFETVQKEKKWDEDEIEILKIMSRLVVNLLLENPAMGMSKGDRVTENAPQSKDDQNALVRSLQEKVSRLEQNRQQMETQIQKHKMTEEQLKTQIAASSETAEKETRETSASAIAPEIEEKMRKQIVELEASLNQMKSELQERKQSEEEIRSNRDSLERQLSQQSLELESFREKHAETTRERKKLEQELLRLKETLAEGTINPKTKELEESHAAAKQRLAKLENELKEKDTTIDSLNLRIEEYKSDMSRLENELGKTRNAIAELEQEYHHLEQDHSQVVQELESLKDIRKEFTNSQKQLEEKQKELAYLKKVEEELNQSKKELVVAKNEREKLQSTYKNLEEDIRQKNSLLRELRQKTSRLEKLELAMFSVDPAGKILTWNHHATSLTGYSAQQAIGKPMTFLIPKAQEVPRQAEMIQKLEKGPLLSNLAKGYFHNNVIPVKTASGKILSTQINLSVIKSESGTMTEAIGYLIKMTNEATSEQLQKTKRLLSTVLGKAGLVLFQLSPDYRVKDISDEAITFLGWDQEKIKQRSFLEMVLPREDWKLVERKVSEELSSHGMSEFESQIILKDSRRHNIHWTVIGDTDTKERTRTLYVVGQDVSEIRRAEKAGKENEMVLHSIVEQATDGFVTIDENGIIQSVNPATEKLFGHAAEELVGRNVDILMPAPYSKEHSHYIQNYLKTGKARIVGGAPREFLARHKDGSTFPVEITVREIYRGYRRLFVGIIHDISKQKELEVSFYETQEKLRKFMEAENDAILISNYADQKILDANESAVQLFGHDSDKLLKLSLNDLATESETTSHAGNGNGRGLGLFIRNPLKYYKKKDGTVFPAQITATTFMVKDQKLCLTVIRDISQLRRQEALLREGEEQLRTILNQSEAAIYIKDTEGRYSLVNSKFESLFNVQNADISGKTDFEIFPKNLAEDFQSKDQRVIETGAPVNSEENILHNDGAHRYQSLKFPLRNSAGVLYAICGMLIDITERQQAERELEQLKKNMDEIVRVRIQEKEQDQQKLIRSEKIEATRNLADSLADQVNNPVHGIRNILKEVVDRVPMEEIHKGLLMVAMNECGRIVSLVEQIVNCFAPPKGELESVDLNRLIEETIKANQPQLQERQIHLEKHFSPDLPSVKGVGSQLREAINNLLQNAEEAFTDKNGRILIATERDSSRVKIHIQDTGCGIPPEHLKCIFDPFFTTKTELNRHGLGLLVSLGIVKNHRGDIDVFSQPGKGTTFTITLPFKSE